MSEKALLENAFDISGLIFKLVGKKSGEARKFVEENVLPFIAQYHWKLAKFFFWTMAPSFILTYIGIRIESNALKILGGTWRAICTIGLFVYGAPIGIIFEAISGGLAGSGARFVGKMKSVFIAELFFTLIICVFPVQNNLANFPIFVLGAVILGIIGSESGKYKTITYGTAVIMIMLGLSFWIPDPLKRVGKGIQSFNDSYKEGNYSSQNNQADGNSVNPSGGAPAAETQGQTQTNTETQAPSAPTPIIPPVPVFENKFCSNQYNENQQAWQNFYHFPEAGYYTINAYGNIEQAVLGDDGEIKFISIGPNGNSYGEQTYQNQLPMPNRNFGCLIGKTETLGEFFVGERTTIHVEYPMDLWLNVNHHQRAENFSRNKGGLNIEVKKTS